MAAIAVSPLRCRVWNWHPRLEENVTEESCRTEISSFEKHGQLIPVLGRRLRGDPDYDFELIYGARRLFVARHLNCPLLLELCELSDRDGLIAMDLENRLRKDVSAYERALSYERWLREGHFSSQGELVSALRISRPQLTRLLKLVRLPPTVIQAFSSATDICEAWGDRLATLLKDPETEQYMLQAATSIAALVSRPPAAEIYERLCAAGKAGRTSSVLERIVKDERGDELFRVKRQRGSVVFSVLMDLLSQELLDEIECAVTQLLDPRNTSDLAAYWDSDTRDSDAMWT